MSQSTPGLTRTDDGGATCKCGAEYSDKAWKHLNFFGWFVCERCRVEYKVIPQ